MAVYTLELKTLIDNGVNIFDFEYPIWNESYREVFEQNFINHFYFREIGAETVARFKHYLKTELNLIMPYWNKVYSSQALEQRILDNYDVKETYERTVEGTHQSQQDGTNKNLFTDTGRKRTDINDVDYVSSITKDIAQSTSSGQSGSTESWTRTMTGNIGVQTDSMAVEAYERSLRNVDLEVFEQLDNLFMQVF